MKMKKIALALATLSFIFASCNNPKESAAVEETPAQQECQHKKDGENKHCKEMTEEQKARCEAWKNWEEQTPEKKAEMIAERKACIDKKIADQETRAAEMKAKREEFKTKWANFDKLDMEAQKALIDEFHSCHKKCYGDKKHECTHEKSDCKQKKSDCEKAK